MLKLNYGKNYYKVKNQSKIDEFDFSVESTHYLAVVIAAYFMNSVTSAYIGS